MIETLGMIAPSRRGYRTAINYVDLYTGEIHLFLLKNKLKLVDTLATMNTLAINDTGRSIQIHRVDGGSEFDIASFRKYYQDSGITVETSAPEQQWSNGSAERAWRTLKTKTHSYLLQSGLGRSYWCYAMKYASKIYSQMPTR